MATTAVSRPRLEPFIQRHGLWNDEQREAADRVRAEIRERGLRFIRLGWGDQHGIVRGKTLSVPEFMRVLEDGKDFQLVTTLFDTTNHPIVAPFAGEGPFGVEEMMGLPDGVLVPDPTTFHVLPWVPDTGWLLADAHLNSGAPCPFSTRQLLRQQISRLASEGFEYTTGLEIEFYVTRLLDPRLSPEESGWPPEPPRVEALAHGFQYLTENRNDEVDEILSVIWGTLEGLGLPIASLEDEWGPGQCEVTFGPQPAMRAADDALLVRTAIKQVCRRHGYHATFMACPALPNFFFSGWHLHQSLVDTATGANAFTERQGDELLSEVGRGFLGGLLEHAGAASVFTTPTITGYKRFRPDSFAPENACWAFENRGAMLRVIGGPGSEGARIENRIGDPAANPYLYMASQLVAGRAGIAAGTDPGPPVSAAYLNDRPRLPHSLMEALDALRADTLFRAELGDTFVDYMLGLKSFEVSRFLSHVTDWEQREYFEVF